MEAPGRPQFCWLPGCCPTHTHSCPSPEWGRPQARPPELSDVRFLGVWLLEGSGEIKAGGTAPLRGAPDPWGSGGNAHPRGAGGGDDRAGDRTQGPRCGTQDARPRARSRPRGRGQRSCPGFAQLFQHQGHRDDPLGVEMLDLSVAISYSGHFYSIACMNTLTRRTEVPGTD